MAEEQQAKKDAILRVLREHWPEAGGQSSAAVFARSQEACADALIHGPVRDA